MAQEVEDMEKEIAFVTHLQREHQVWSFRGEDEESDSKRK